MLTFLILKWEKFKTRLSVMAADRPVSLALLVLLFVASLTVIVSLPFYFDDEGDPYDFIEGVVTELHGMVFDLLIIGLLVFWFNKLGETRLENKRYHEEIEDFLNWESDEAKFRIIGNIKRLNRNGVTNINLKGAYLRGAQLSFTGDLRVPQDLNKIILWQADLRHSDLTGANLENARLEGVPLEYSRFKSANLKSAKLRDCNLEYATMTSANLEKANLIAANLKHTRLDEAILREAILTTAELDYADLDGADLTNVMASGLDDLKSGADPAAVSLLLWFMQGGNLVTGKKIHTKTSFRHVHLKKSLLVGAKLRYADLTGAYLEDADLTGADLEGAILESTKLDRAIMKDVNLQNTVLPKEDNDILNMFGVVKTLYGASLDPRIDNLLRERHPELFEQA